LGREIGDHITQAMASAKMRRRQRAELREACHPSQRRTDMMGSREGVEFMSWHQP